MIRSLILRITTRLLVPILLLFSIFMLLRGHNLPGGGFVGGLVAGFGLGTNRYDGMVAGFRAGAYGVLALALLAVVTLFVLWYSASQELFFYWAPFYGTVALVALVPVYGFSGIVGGALGVLVRRWVVPDRLNPAAY